MIERKINAEKNVISHNLTEIASDNAKKRFNEIVASVVNDVPENSNLPIVKPAPTIKPDAVKTALDEYKNEFKKHKLSVIITYCDSDEHLVQGCIDSLPTGIELIICKSVACNEVLTPDKKLIVKSNNDNVIIAEYRYFAGSSESDKYDYSINTFSFSNLRNAVKQIATRKFIMMLDADERVSIEQTDLEMIDRVATTRNNVGGFICNVVSISKMQHGTERIIIPLCRIIINDNTKYSNRVHEQITDSLTASGFGFVETTIVIKHIGYDSLNFNDKMYRNCGLLASDLHKTPDDTYLLDYVYRTIGTIFTLESVTFTSEQEHAVQIETFLSDAQKLANFGIGLIYDLAGIYENIIGFAKMIEKNSKNLHALKELYKLLCILYQLKIFIKKQV